MNNSAEVIQTDVLVIGGGFAGTRAALEAEQAHAKVTMVMKTGIGKGGATGPYWFGGMSLPTGDTDPQDSPEEMFNDIIHAASGMSDEKLVRILSYEIVDRFKELESWGLNLPNNIGGKYHQHRACFATRPRTVTMFGFSPSAIEVLRQQVQKRDISVIDDTIIINLLTKDRVCVGALGVDKHGRFKVIKAKSTVMATGGAAGIFPPQYDAGAVGAGYTMGFHAGATLFNMEFIQIMPEMNMAFHIPPYFLNPDIYNVSGERFLPRYIPNGVTLEQCFTERMRHVPFSTSDNGKYIDISLYKELLAGRGTTDGFVFFDVTKVAKEDALIRMEQQGVTHMFTRPLDSILAKPQLVRPQAHAFNGGLKINERTETTVPGLYAAGETAGGPHGADRLGGNMVAAGLVFGARAGKFAAKRANDLNEVSIEKAQLDEQCGKASAILASKGGISVSSIESKIRDLMWRSCLTVRNQKGLESCIVELKRIRQEEFPKLSVAGDDEVFRALSIPSMLETAEIVARAALQRKESRGSHYRDDFPERDDKNFRKTMNINNKTLVLGK